jgi:hypothetical protein
MLAEAKRWPERTWAVEGCQGIGRPIANRLLAGGEDVVDVPPKLPARTPGVRHRAGPQDRRYRRALGRAGRHPDGRPWAGWPVTSSWRCCGSSPTAAGRWAKTTPG